MSNLVERLTGEAGKLVPLANPFNTQLQSQLIKRQDEIQRLRELIIQQKEKQSDLNRYRTNVFSEAQENTKLLVAQKQQVELTRDEVGERKRQGEWGQRDTTRVGQDLSVIQQRLEHMHMDRARLLERADSLKTEVCGERGALRDWRAALDISAADISAIQRYNKQDQEQANELERKRCMAKVERDRLHERLMQMCCAVAADERAAHTLATQVEDSRKERGRVMRAWSDSVDNLRARDMDIQQTHQEYAQLEEHMSRLSEECADKRRFADSLAAESALLRREVEQLAAALAAARQRCTAATQRSADLQAHLSSMQRSVKDAQRLLNERRASNKHAVQQIRATRAQIDALVTKLENLQQQKLQSRDQSATTEARARELTNMLADEEKYIQNLSASRERAAQCAFNKRQQLNAAHQRDAVLQMQLRGAESLEGRMEGERREVERRLANQKENLYNLCYQVESVGARVLHLEGSESQRERDAELATRHERLQQVCAVHTARVALLTSHSERLRDDMRALMRELAAQEAHLEKLQGGVRSRRVGADGVRCAVRDAREQMRRARVEEALLRLRVAHASRAVDNLDNLAFNLHAQRLQMDAAMGERRVEVEARVEVLDVQKRALGEDCARLRSDIRERRLRIEQLQKRYDIFISSLGKDDSGQQLSVAYFKIKFACERSEMVAAGTALDAELSRCEAEVSSLQSALQLMRAAHTHYVEHASPLAPQASELQEVCALNEEYRCLHAALEELRVVRERQQRQTSGLREQAQLLQNKMTLLKSTLSEAEGEWERSQDRASRQRARLDNALQIVRTQRRRVRKLLPDPHHYTLFMLETRCGEYAEAVQTALQAVAEAVGLGAGAGAGDGAVEAARRCAELARQHDLAQLLPTRHRRAALLLKKIMATEDEEDLALSTESWSVSSCSSGRRKSPPRSRLTSFREALARKLSEPALAQDENKTMRNVSGRLSVLTLGLEVKRG